MTELLEKYLLRLDCQDTIRDVSVDNLIQLQQKHLEQFVFNSVACYFHKEMKISREYLMQKVILEKQDGFCFEVNSLLYCILQDLGYNVVMYPAIVYSTFTNKVAADPTPSHFCLIVHFEKESYLVDVGFCTRGFLSPIRFEEGISDQGRHGSFKLSKLTDTCWLLQSMNKYRSILYPAAEKNKWYNQFQFDTSKKLDLQDVDQLLKYHLASENFIFKKALCFEAIRKNGILSMWDDQFRSIVFGKTEEDDAVQYEKILSEEHRKQILKDHFDFEYKDIH